MTSKENLDLILKEMAEKQVPEITHVILKSAAKRKRRKSMM